MLRRGERTEGSIIEDISRRIKNLERVASRRVLPPNYEFRYDSTTDQLTIVRISDGASVNLL